jgi:outer membrane protein TolC
MAVINRAFLSRVPTLRAPRGTAFHLVLALSLALAGCRAPWAVGIAPPVVTCNAPAANAPAPAEPVTLGLADCLHLALQRQPAVAVQRAGLEVATDRERALDTLCVPKCLAPDLPVRRQQAAIGVTAAAACVDLAERDTVYAVTRTYFTVLYAREQERVARGVTERLSALNETAARMLKAGARNVTDADVDRTTIYLELAETRRLQAAKGVDRALAALKEAIGLGPGCCLEVPPGSLPEPELHLCRDDVIAWALARRSDLVKAGTFATLTALEVEAQAASWLPQRQTFAAGADIHSRQVPQEQHNTEYRPGTDPPEMPTILVGSRPERMKQAQSLSMRAAALVDKARGLIILEAEDAYKRWEEASEKVPHLRKAAEAGDRLADSLRKDFTSGQKVRPDEVVNAQVLTAQARSQLNEALYQQVLALADLERVTAGGFCASLAGQPVAKTPSPQKESATDKAKQPEKDGAEGKPLELP